MNGCRKYISLTVLVAFFCSTLTPIKNANAAPLVAGLPTPGAMVNLSATYTPLLIKGLRVHPENPLVFDFIVDTGNSPIKSDSKELRAQSEKLIKYFLATLTIPEKDLWVNLSPYEKDRIIEEPLGQTELGRDMLAQDYLLKQLTASLVYPEKELGKKFWDKVYAQARERFGVTNIPVNTFNKVWILPDQADIFVRNNTAFVVNGHLKVMLEEDYLASKKNSVASSSENSQIIREIILPEIEKEVNQGQNFAPLRQIFNSMILATWYKKSLKEALLNQVYANKAKINGVDADDKAIKAKIYEQYLQAYKKGVFNYIKETNTSNGQVTPKKYFSGGEVFTNIPVSEISNPSPAMIAPAGSLFSVNAAMSSSATVYRAARLNGLEKAQKAKEDEINTTVNRYFEALQYAEPLQQRQVAEYQGLARFILEDLDEHVDSATRKKLIASVMTNIVGWAKQDLDGKLDPNAKAVFSLTAFPIIHWGHIELILRTLNQKHLSGLSLDLSAQSANNPLIGASYEDRMYLLKIMLQRFNGSFSRDKLTAINEDQRPEETGERRLLESIKTANKGQTLYYPVGKGYESTIEQFAAWARNSENAKILEERDLKLVVLVNRLSEAQKVSAKQIANRVSVEVLDGVDLGINNTAIRAGLASTPNKPAINGIWFIPKSLVLHLARISPSTLGNIMGIPDILKDIDQKGMSSSIAVLKDFIDNVYSAQGNYLITEEIVELFMPNLADDKKQVLADKMQSLLDKAMTQINPREVAAGIRFWEGLDKTTVIKGDYWALQEKDVSDLDSISASEGKELESIGANTLRNGQIAVMGLWAGASSRMNTHEAPAEIKKIVKGKELGSKAVVPIGQYNGDVITYADIAAFNLKRLFDQIDAAAKKAGIVSNVTNNVVGFMTNDAYQSEHDAMFIAHQNYGMKNPIHSFRQRLGPIFQARPIDVEKYFGEENKQTFKNEEERSAWRQKKERALKIAGESSLRIDSRGDESAVIVPEDRQPLGHGEFLMQLIESGEIIRLIDQGIRFVSIRNVDNYAAKYDSMWLRTIGYAVKNNLDFLIENSLRVPGQKGGVGVGTPNGHVIGEDPILNADIDKTTDRPKVPSTSGKWMNNAVGIASIPYILQFFKQEGQSDAELIDELRNANAEQRAAIADRGRKLLPKIYDVKPGKSSDEKYKGGLTSKGETNLWTSTIVSGKDKKIAVVGVRGIGHFDLNAFKAATAEQKIEMLRRVRFMATKQWDVPESSRVKLKKELETLLGREMTEEEAGLRLESYEGNKPLADPMIKYIMEAPLVDENIFQGMKDDPAMSGQVGRGEDQLQQKLFTTEQMGAGEAALVATLNQKPLTIEEQRSYLEKARNAFFSEVQAVPEIMSGMQDAFKRFHITSITFESARQDQLPRNLEALKNQLNVIKNTAVQLMQKAAQDKINTLLPILVQTDKFGRKKIENLQVLQIELNALKNSNVSADQQFDALKIIFNKLKALDQAMTVAELNRINVLYPSDESVRMLDKIKESDIVSLGLVNSDEDIEAPEKARGFLNGEFSEQDLQNITTVQRGTEIFQFLEKVGFLVRVNGHAISSHRSQLELRSFIEMNFPENLNVVDFFNQLRRPSVRYYPRMPELLVVKNATFDVIAGTRVIPDTASKGQKDYPLGYTSAVKAIYFSERFLERMKDQGVKLDDLLVFVNAGETPKERAEMYAKYQAYKRMLANRDDQAQLANPGGIDLNTKGMRSSVTGDKIDIQFDPAMVEQFKRGDFTGVRPVILNVTPLTSVLPLLGLAPRREDDVALGV